MIGFNGKLDGLSAPSHVRNARTVVTAAEIIFRAAVLKTPKAELGGWLADRLPSLGPSYIKVGQFVSSRHDIFGEDFTKPFERLRDAVPPIASDKIRELLKTRVDMTKFASVDPEPMASASIGQVHRGTLSDGRAVVVKVKRPGIDQMIREDIAFVGALVTFLGTLWTDDRVSQQFDDIKTGLADVEAYLLQEVDFSKEVRNIERFRRMYANNRDVRIPRVYPSMCCDSVIVMEYVASTPISQYRVTEPKGPEKDVEKRRATANKLMDVFVQQLVYKGFVHGDPHPGNIGVDAKNNIVIYDFGNVIEIAPTERQRMKEMIYQLLLGNNEAVINTLEKLGVVVLDRKELDGYIDMYREYMRTIDIAGISAGHTPDTVLPLKLTDKFMRLIRVYGMLEGTCKRINDDFNYYDMLDDYIDGLFFDEEFVNYKLTEDIRSVTDMIGQSLGRRPPATTKPGVQSSTTTSRPTTSPPTWVWQSLVVVLLLIERMNG